MAMGMLLLSLSGGLVALGAARIVCILRERRAARLRSDLQALQLVTASRLQYRIPARPIGRSCLECGEYTGCVSDTPFCRACWEVIWAPVAGGAQ